MNIFQNILHFNFDIFLKNVNFLNRNFEKVKKWDFDKINLNSLFVEINTPNVIKHYYTFSQSQKNMKIDKESPKLPLGVEQPNGQCS